MDKLKDLKLKEIGEYIKNIREQKNISIYSIEKNYHIDRGNWSRIENGKHGSFLKPETLKQIAQILDINYIELYKIAGYIDDEAISEYINKKDSE